MHELTRAVGVKLDVRVYKGERAMSPRTARKPSKAVKAPRRAHKAMTREARSAYAEIEQAVKHLEKSIGEIQQGVRKAERKFEAEARARIRTLRKDARAQLTRSESEAARGCRRLEARVRSRRRFVVGHQAHGRLGSRGCPCGRRRSRQALSCRTGLRFVRSVWPSRRRGQGLTSRSSCDDVAWRGRSTVRLRRRVTNAPGRRHGVPSLDRRKLAFKARARYPGSETRMGPHSSGNVELGRI